jgi:hypothetical protein
MKSLKQQDPKPSRTYTPELDLSSLSNTGAMNKKWFYNQFIQYKEPFNPLRYMRIRRNLTKTSFPSDNDMNANLTLT